MKGKKNYTGGGKERGMGIYEKERKLEKGEREEKLHWRRERKRYGNRWEERN